MKHRFVEKSFTGVVLCVTGKGGNGDMQVCVGVGHSGQVAGVYIDPVKIRKQKVWAIWRKSPNSEAS